MVRLKKAVPPTESGITRRAVADLQAQIEKLTAAVAALSTQHATMVFRQRNHQADNIDEFEEDENPLSRLCHQPPIPNKNNDSDLDLDAKVHDTRNNENSYVDQLGDPIFDVSNTEEDDENYSEQKKIPIFDVFDQDATEKFSVDVDMADVDVAKISPIYDMFDDDEMEQVTIEKVEVQSVKFNEYVYAQGTPTLSPEYFATSNEVIRDFNLKDTSPSFQTMMTTVGRNDNYFWKSIRSNKREDHKYVPKPELIHICEERAGNNVLDLQKKHINYGAWRNNFNRHINRKPPDRVQHQGREAEQEETKNLIAKITKLEEALLSEQEKNQTLEHELSEIRRNIRMLNTGSKNLDKILCMGRTEKTTAGLGYQGGPSSSHIVSVRGNSVEPNKIGTVSEFATNLPMELPTASNVYTCYCKTSLMKHQDCVRNIWSTGIMSTILQTHSDFLGEEFVGVLHQKHSNAPYWNLHQAHMRVVRKGEVEDCNDEKLREAVYTILDEDSSEQTMISLGLEILHHHSFESTLSLNKVLLASILVKIHKNKLYMLTLVSGRSLQAGESHSHANVLFERNTTFIVCWKNMIMVNWNINESSDSFSMNLFKKNHAEGLTANMMFLFRDGWCLHLAPFWFMCSMAERI